jgi:hypothetical protein
LLQLSSVQRDGTAALGQPLLGRRTGRDGGDEEALIRRRESPVNGEPGQNASSTDDAATISARSTATAADFYSPHDYGSHVPTMAATESSDQDEDPRDHLLCS